MGSLAVFVFAVMLLLLQSAARTFLPASLPMPALVLMAALYPAFSSRWSISGTIVFAFLTGYVFDLAAGVPLGIHALSLPVTALVASAVGAIFEVRGPFSRAIGLFVFRLLFALVVVGAGRIGGAGAGFGGLGRLLLEAAATAALAPLLLGLFDRIERRTAGTPNVYARAGLSRGGLELPP